MSFAISLLRFGRNRWENFLQYQIEGLMANPSNEDRHQHHLALSIGENS
jgi:hypothetical protein